MPTTSEMFPKRFLQGEDLQGKDWTLTIKEVRLVKMTDPENRSRTTKKWVVYFRETRKGCVLNVTRTTEIMKALGVRDTDDWIDRRITMFAQPERHFGQTWDVIHFCAAPAEESQDQPLPAATGALTAFVNTIVREVPYYPDEAAVVVGLQECGYWPFQTSQASKARRALESHAERRQLERAVAGPPPDDPTSAASAKSAESADASPVPGILAKVQGYVDGSNGRWAGRDSEDGQRQAIYKKLAQDVGLDDAARHRLQEAVFGKASLKTFTFAEAAGMLRWMSDRAFADEALAVLSEHRDGPAAEDELPHGAAHCV